MPDLKELDDLYEQGDELEGYKTPTSEEAQQEDQATQQWLEEHKTEEEIKHD